MSLFNLNSKSQEATSLVQLEDIPENNPLYAQLQAYLSQNQSDTFASIAKDDVDNIKSYEKRKEEPWKIFQRYLLNGLYFTGESYKTRSYYETLLISTSVEFQHFSDWDISSMTKRQISLNKVSMKFTYWDYIQAFNKVIYYNNERHKHTWFIKVCAKIFANPIPNWFLNWWSYHEPTIKILPDPFLKLYREWVKAPEVDFNKEQIPCLYRTYYNNFWDKLMKKYPPNKVLIRTRTVGFDFQDNSRL
ncbi:hypothetical protein H5410_030719 [Solanum commersonii]|uniref:Uncharacterized protein n=1 Tax=Solanum commersonii TaxID=4109 RepID=A0A9J5YH12_SOLCO|nr:hypothetical protein H5410_030719 [Solanum commersonii]